MMQTKSQRVHLLKSQQARLMRLVLRTRKADQKLVYWRMIIVVAALILGRVAYSGLGEQGMWGVFILGTGIFVWLVGKHQKVRKIQQRTLVLHSLLGEQMARMQLDWSGMPEGLLVPPELHTSLEIDFDLIGERSLHRLLDTTETTGGSSLLRSWLIRGYAQPAEIFQRQQLVTQLRERRGFCNRLALNMRVLSGKTGNWSSESLQLWLERKEEDHLSRWMWGLIGLVVSSGILFMLDLQLGGKPLWMLTYGLYVVGLGLMISRVSGSFQEAAQIRDGLEQMQMLFGMLEQYDYRDATQLRKLCRPFWEVGKQPRRYLKRVVKILAKLGVVQANMLTALVVHLFFPWAVILTVQLRKEKAALAEHFPIWMKHWFELEASAALATFAWLNPRYVFGEVAAESPPLTATAIGHPLIPDAEKIYNDFSAENLGSLTLITGSNMSGKSTFLRTIGINMILALAGSVVDAQHFAAQPLQLYSCIKVNDSVLDGFSYFYAEVRRLRGLLDALQASTDNGQPILYFIDEIFRGTNNRERLIGSRSLVHELAGANGIGFVSTHDLELVQLTDANPHIRNFHFREQIVSGLMEFDYTLRTGPCPTTNALKIMQLAGLPISFEFEDDKENG